MKEIKILLKQLRSYPENSFITTQEGFSPFKPYEGREGLIVRDVNGYRLGFIETGAGTEVVTDE